MCKANQTVFVINSLIHWGKWRDFEPRLGGLGIRSETVILSAKSRELEDLNMIEAISQSF